MNSVCFQSHSVSKIARYYSMNREKLLIELGHRSLSRRLAAAVSLVRLALKADESSQQNVLNISVEPKREREDHLVLSAGAQGTKKSGVLELKSVIAAAHDIDLLVLIAVKAVFPDSPVSTEDAGAKQRFELPVQRDLDALQRGSVFSECASMVADRIGGGADVILVGQSSSGKTVASAQVAIRLLQEGWTVSWLDLSSPNRDAQDMVLAFARTQVGRASQHLIVIDDLQVNPGESKKVAALVSVLRSNLHCQLRCLILTWESAHELAQEGFPSAMTISAFGDQIIPQLAEGILGTRETLDEDERNRHHAVIERVRQISSGDLLIANLMLQYFRDAKNVPDGRELAELAFRQALGNGSLSNSAYALLYRLASLSQLEVDIAATYAENFGQDALHELLQTPCVKRNGAFLAVGHRTLARLILIHLETSKPDLIASLPSAGQIAVEYLKGASRQQIVSTLERLDLTSLAYRPTDQHGTAFLGKAWETFQLLGNYLTKQAAADATWGDNTASAVFAAQAFSDLGNAAWETTNTFLRSRWQVSGSGQLPEPIGSPPVEQIDFDQMIRDTMAEEERAGRFSYPSGQRSDEIDFVRMHRTWVLGLLLGLEGAARRPEPDLLQSLKKCAEKNQERDGAFYPQRVPWVTARVLIGLSMAGQSVLTSAVVKRACDWLRRPWVASGPYRAGCWEPGTGRWNTRVGTTAMCVNALVRCGVPTTDPAVQAGTKFLLSNRREWVKPGQEIDGVFSLSTVLTVNGRWREVKNELQTLLGWIRNREAWSEAGRKASDSHQESCKVAQVAVYLLQIVWDTVHSELPLLLEGFAVTIFNPDGLRGSLGIPIKLAADAIAGLRAKIDGEIRSREEICARVSLPIPEIAQALEEWRKRKGRLRELEILVARITEGSSPHEHGADLSRLNQKLNELGEECMRGAWVKLNPQGRNA